MPSIKTGRLAIIAALLACSIPTTSSAISAAVAVASRGHVRAKPCDEECKARRTDERAARFEERRAQAEALATPRKPRDPIPEAAVLSTRMRVINLQRADQQ